MTQVATKSKEEATAFDGSPMPTQALPTFPQKTAQMLLSQAVSLEAKKLSSKGMIYGNVGTKKTTTAMEILQGITPEDKKILYFDTAEGWSVLQNFPELMRRVVHVQYENIEQLLAWADAIKSGAAPFNLFGGILFDEYTGMHDEDLNWIVASRAEQRAKDGEFKDPFSPALPDYNGARIRSNKVIAKFMRLENVHLMFIGHEKEDKRLNKIPDMPDKAGKAVYQKLHFLYHVGYSKEGNWQMQTTNSAKITAKNRVNGIGSYTDAKQFIECYNKWGVTTPIKMDIEPIDETEDVNLLKILND